jgi:hypothetical protein
MFFAVRTFMHTSAVNCGNAGHFAVRSHSSSIRRRSILIAVLLATLAALPAAGKEDAPTAKISPELKALYEAYLRAQRDATSFVPDPLMPVVDDRVIVDASASGDVAALLADIVALGARGAVSAGRIVSGQVPIAALGSLAALPTLQFAWPAVSAMNRRRPGTKP